MEDYVDDIVVKSRRQGDHALLEYLPKYFWDFWSTAEG